MTGARIFASAVASAVLAGAGAGPAMSASLTSPSGNVKCEFGQFEDYSGRQIARVRCTVQGINDTAWVIQRTGKGKRVRATDAVVGGPILRYGQSRTMGAGFVCTSRKSGVTCRYRPTGHGFTVSQVKSRRRTF